MQTERAVPPAPTKSVALATVAGLAAATTVVALVDPHEGGRYPLCPLLAVTGLYCPFCGGLRAVHDLTHLDVAGALDRNPLAVLVLPVLGLAVLVWAWSAYGGRRLPRVPVLALNLGLVVLLVFAVLRNLPGWTWLSPA